MRKPYLVYILKCADGSYYTGSTVDLALCLEAHQQGLDPKAYTHSRGPVQPVWAQAFPEKLEALESERQVKGWSRAKKEALIREDWEALRELSKDRRPRE